MSAIRWARRKKTCLRYLRTPKAQTSDLIGACVYRLLKSIVSRIATSKFSIFKLVSVAEETGLSLALSETPKTGFVASRPRYGDSVALSSLLAVSPIVCWGMGCLVLPISVLDPEGVRRFARTPPPPPF